ncbi:sensor histidine kinase [Texcoconibacillus texcoconensis]|uniref:Pentatricopeptide repeat protein n=1 Tax=Texcoconibacillus texcoconensis TaxID=1095777 RepID=A0A840QSA1_9BACI|nr:GHKL domain-containing protein [Texcoconibacillus texcoconensis]MBB5174193.1 pentatricopeptide repeat protein [Texcoconibacillus texcoconensis]
MNFTTLAITILIQLLVVFFAIISIAGFQDNALDIIGVPIHLIFVILLNILSLYILGKIFKHEEKRKVYNAESTHVKEFRSLVTSVRSDRHDLNNHLTVISGLMKMKNFDAADKYIQEMIGNININNKALKIKNPILSSMLYSKMDKYQRAGIPFSVNIANEEIETILSSTDLIRLISNLLDNAYEATLKMPNAERKIELEITKVNETVKLIVKNTSTIKEITEYHFKIGYSTKSKSDRGYGLAIIQEVTEKYNGFLEVDTKDNVVSIEISFPKAVEK